MASRTWGKPGVGAWVGAIVGAWVGAWVGGRVGTSVGKGVAGGRVTVGGGEVNVMVGVAVTIAGKVAVTVGGKGGMVTVGWIGAGMLQLASASRQARENRIKRLFIRDLSTSFPLTPA